MKTLLSLIINWLPEIDDSWVLIIGGNDSRTLGHNLLTLFSRSHNFTIRGHELNNILDISRPYFRQMMCHFVTKFLLNKHTHTHAHIRKAQTLYKKYFFSIQTYNDLSLFLYM